MTLLLASRSVDQLLANAAAARLDGHLILAAAFYNAARQLVLNRK
jgi:hypothetical protein